MQPNFKFRSVKNGVESSFMIPKTPKDEKPIIIRDKNYYATQADLLVKENIINKASDLLNANDITYPTTKAVKTALAAKADGAIVEFGNTEHRYETIKGYLDESKVVFLSYEVSIDLTEAFSADPLLATAAAEGESSGEGEETPPEDDSKQIMKCRGYAVMSQITDSEAKFVAVVPDNKNVEIVLEFTCHKEDSSGGFIWTKDFDVMLTTEYLNSGAIKLVGVWG